MIATATFSHKFRKSTATTLIIGFVGVENKTVPRARSTATAKKLGGFHAHIELLVNQ